MKYSKAISFILLAIFCGLVLKAQQYKKSENYSKLDKHNQWAIFEKQRTEDRQLGYVPRERLEKQKNICTS